MLTAILAAFLAAPSSAAGPAEAILPEGYVEMSALVPRVSLLAVDACFERIGDADADALGLPKRFCLKKVGTRVKARSVYPSGVGLIDEGQGTTDAHISGLARTERGWTINVDLFSDDADSGVCGKLNHAFAAVYFDVDLEGRVLDGPVEVRGFLIDGSSLCRTPAKAVEFLYRRLP